VNMTATTSPAFDQRHRAHPEQTANARFITFFAGWHMGKAFAGACVSGIPCRSFLPERTFAARRTVSGMLRGETKSGVVIAGDMILKWKRIWSQVAAGLRSPFRQKGPTSARTIHRSHPAAIMDNRQEISNNSFRT